MVDRLRLAIADLIRRLEAHGYAVALDADGYPTSLAWPNDLYRSAEARRDERWFDLIGRAASTARAAAHVRAHVAALPPDERECVEGELAEIERFALEYLDACRVAEEGLALKAREPRKGTSGRRPHDDNRWALEEVDRLRAQGASLAEARRKVAPKYGISEDALKKADARRRKRPTPA